ncbi:MAG: hypothetical protein ACJ8R9_16440 [Steroidobacteraceae bacterium]
MTNDLWLQMSGAIAGGLVGSCAGFLANIIRARLEFRRHRHSVASALVGELQALREHVSAHYLVRLDNVGTTSVQPFPYHWFRGERDYMPIFRSLGQSIGYLPSPLPRDLAFWYAGFTVCLERAHELSELARRDEPGCLEAALELAAIQRSELVELMDTGDDLLCRLEEQADRLTI